MMFWPAAAIEAQRRERRPVSSSGGIVHAQREGRKTASPGHGRAAFAALPNQIRLTGNGGRIEEDAVDMKFAVLVLVVLLALGLVAGSVWVWKRIASRGVTRPEVGTPKRLDTTMGELRDMREALRSAEQFRQVPIRRT
jgi:hypothetical protein